jgi:hypothetical protein
MGDGDAIVLWYNPQNPRSIYVFMFARSGTAS